jgi:hypothetical protein
MEARLKTRVRRVYKLTMAADGVRAVASYVPAL